MTPIQTAQKLVLTLCALLTLGTGGTRASAGVSPEVAKEIMGDSFLGEVGVARAFGVKLTEKQRANVRVVPWDGEGCRKEYSPRLSGKTAGTAG